MEVDYLNAGGTVSMHKSSCKFNSDWYNVSQHFCLTAY